MYLGHMITLDYTIILENDYIFEKSFFFKFKFTSLLFNIRNVFLKRCICNLLMIAESKNYL